MLVNLKDIKWKKPDTKYQSKLNDSHIEWFLLYEIAIDVCMFILYGVCDLA